MAKGGLDNESYEFAVKANTEGRIEWPDELLRVVRGHEAVRMIVLISEETDEDEEDEAWRRYETERFLRFYSVEEATYNVKP